MLDFEKLKADRDAADARARQQRSEELQKIRVVTDKIFDDCFNFVAANGEKCQVTKGDCQVVLTADEDRSFTVGVEDRSRFTIGITKPNPGRLSLNPRSYKEGQSVEQVTQAIFDWYEALPSQTED